MIEQGRAFQSPELPMPGIAECAPLWHHGAAGHGKDPFIQLPPLLRRAGRSPGAVESQQGPGTAAVPISAPGTAAALPMFAPQGSLAAVVKRRLQQVEELGHTPMADAKLRLDQLPRMALHEAQLAVEDLTSNARCETPEEAERLRAQLRRAARKKLVDMCALGLAAIDRLDMEPNP